MQIIFVPVSRLFHNVFLSTGSNQGNSIQNLLKTNVLIAQQIGFVVKTSSFYKTAAWGLTEQPDFINQCIQVYTPFPPKLLLKKLLNIEKQMGRVRQEKWGPRTIDIDILLFDDCKMDENSIQIPHPHIQNRLFVLAPLEEIAPGLIHPSLKKTIKTLLLETPDKLSIQRLCL